MEETKVSLRIVYRVVFVMFLAVMSLRAFAQTVTIAFDGGVVGGAFEPNPIFDEPSEPDEDGFETTEHWSAAALPPLFQRAERASGAYQSGGRATALQEKKAGVSAGLFALRCELDQCACDLSSSLPMRIP